MEFSLSQQFPRFARS